MLLLGTQKTIQKYPKITVVEWEAHGFEAGTSIVSAQMMVKFDGWLMGDVTSERWEDIMGLSWYHGVPQ